MSREAIPTWFFAIAIVRRGDRFLLVHERKHGQTWYFPAGRVEPGETLAAAVARETREEAGIAIVLDGILRIEHTPTVHGVRVRAFFTAHAADDTPPKQTADEHSLGAAWVSLDELAALPLRGEEVQRIARELSEGAVVHPLSVLAAERNV